jgi:hypothetical protein
VSATLKRTGRGVLIRPDRLGPDADRTAAGELDGVAEEVEQYLADLAGVARQLPLQIAVHEGSQFGSLPARLAGQQGHDSVHQDVQVEWRYPGLELSGLDLREIQDVVDGAQQRLG